MGTMRNNNQSSKRRPPRPIPGLQPVAPVRPKSRASLSLFRRHCNLLAFALALLTNSPTVADDVDRVTPRPLKSAADRHYWLENMVGWHHFTSDEAALATGLDKREIEKAVREQSIAPRPWTAKKPGEPIRILPYPGGRHPRIGFRDGAIDPQRETKVSVFTPWADGGYVVVDVPEAIWSDLGLTYLAHTHIPTIWSRQSHRLEPLEWKTGADGTLTNERRLPNGIAFSALVQARNDKVDFQLSLTNGTSETLTDLRVQVCAMLKMAKGFEKQTNGNKQFASEFAFCSDELKNRWIILAFRPIHRAWGNQKCPCLHADPKFPDCARNQTTRVFGRLWFYEGSEISAELDRIRQDWKSSRANPEVR